MSGSGISDGIVHIIKCKVMLKCLLCILLGMVVQTNCQIIMGVLQVPAWLIRVSAILELLGIFGTDEHRTGGKSKSNGEVVSGWRHG